MATNPNVVNTNDKNKQGDTVNLQYASTGVSPNNPNTAYEQTHLGGEGVYGRDFNEYVNTNTTTGNYKGLGSIAHDGTSASLMAVEQTQKDNVGNTNPDNYVAYTPEQLKQLAAQMGVDPSRLENNAARGFMADDPNYIYSNRDVVEGGAGADEFWMNDGALDMIRVAQQNWNNATSQEEKDYWHTVAEKIRATQGYSGGTDGTLYLTHGYLDVGDYANSGNGGSRGDEHYGGMGSGQGSSGASGSQSDLKGLLDAWKDAAIKQQNGQIDYAVAKAVADLERALADAQPQFKEQAESVDRSARQAMDNSALYAEMRGDKGGIGQEQYNSIQNTQAQNHLTVQQAQTKLATDTQRQIADLRAQGEFEKADAALQITQQYLQQLIGLEQWAAEYNLSVDQFNESVRQWEAEYNMAMQQFQTSQSQWQQQFNASQNQWQQEFDFAQKQYQNSLEQWQQEFAAEQMLAQMKLANSGNNGNTKLSISDIDLGAAYQYLYDNNLTNRSSTDAIVAMLGIQGIPSDVAKQVAALYVDNGYSGLKNAGPSNGTIVNQTTYDAVEALWDRGSNAPTQVTVPDSKPFYQSADRLNLPVYGFDLPPLIEMLRQYGAIEEGADGYLRWKNGWNASNYSARLSQIAGEAIWDRHS